MKNYNHLNKYVIGWSLLMALNPAQSGESGSNIMWINESNGSWYDNNNWEGGLIPSAGDDVFFEQGNLAIETVDVNNGGLGVNSPDNQLRIERKVIFNDNRAPGDPSTADDGMVFNLIQANGRGGQGVTFNVPVIANTITSNRHGAIFNREITVNEILARSAHQDKWQINAGSTDPIQYIEIDQNRGPDGSAITSFFAIRSDLEVEYMTQVWGTLRVREGITTEVNEYLYFDYTAQEENNNINPIQLAGELIVDRFLIMDVHSNTLTFLAPGTYGSLDNQSTDFQVDFITRDGVLTVVSGEFVFANGFE